MTQVAKFSWISRTSDKEKLKKKKKENRKIVTLTLITFTKSWESLSEGSVSG